MDLILHKYENKGVEMDKKSINKKASVETKGSLKPVILNNEFEFMEVGDSNVLISPKGLEFYAVNREFWDFLCLFKYGADLNYVVEAIEIFYGKTKPKIYLKEFKDIFEELENCLVLVPSKKFINPRIEMEFCKAKPVLKIYDRKWIEDNHPELLISVNFSDTWSPAENFTDPT